MSATNQISHQPFIVTENHPRTISTVFDGVEVHRIEDGVDTFMITGFTKYYTPEVIQQYWDEDLVLELFPKLNLLTVNRLPIPQTTKEPVTYDTLN